MTVDVSDDEKIYRTVSELSNFLRRSGSKILTNTSALSLSWSVYQNVSKALAIFHNQTEERHKQLDCKQILDLEYLTSFLSRLPSLRLTHGHHGPGADTGLVTVSGLHGLETLQCDRCPLTSIQDLVSLRGQLVTLSVSRCPHVSPATLLRSCMGSSPAPTDPLTLGSSPSPLSWSRLTQLTLSHGRLSSLSVDLSLAPHLTHLDCSHNRISDTSGLETLSNLCHLNLSYNHLSAIPLVHEQALLTHLHLAYNRIEQLLSLSDMLYLAHVDLAANCLMHHDVLAPLSGLTKLESVDLRYNPLSTHPRHRQVASSWLNPSLASTKPILDNEQLSRAELLQVGSSRLIISPSVSPSYPVSAVHGGASPDQYGDGDHGLESVSMTGGSREGSVVSSSVRMRRHGRGRSRRKVREAVISDETEYSSEYATTETVTQGDNTGDNTHDTIQDLRGKFGDNWLRSGASDQLHSLLGIDQSEERSVDQSEERSVDQSESSAKQDQEIKTEASTKPKRRLSDEMPDAIDKADNDDVAKVDTTVKDDVVEDRKEKKDSTASGDQCFYSVYSDRETTPDKSCKVNVKRSIPGDDSGLLEDLVLVINKEFIREQDSKGVTRVKWFLHSLEQMEMVGRVTKGKDMVRVVMMFNTVRRDSRERLYTMTETVYSTVMTLVGGVLESAAKSSLSQPGLQCVVCGSMFSEAPGGKCPFCGSDKVLEQTLTRDTMEEEEEVSLGIPACEMLDLASCVLTETEDQESDTVTTERSYRGAHVSHQDTRVQDSTRVTTADIHSCHTVSTPDHTLPDVCPRPEPTPSTSPPPSADSRLSSPSEDSRQSSSSPSVVVKDRSDSSSDISVLSNPSEASIEVIPSDRSAVPAAAVRDDAAVRAAAVQLLAPAAVTTMAVSPASAADHGAMLESSSSGSLVTSGEHSSVVLCSTPPHSDTSSMVSMLTPLTSPIKTADTMDTTMTPYTSTHTSPVKLAREDGDSSLFLSCQETDSSDADNDDTTVVDTEDTDDSPPETPDPPLLHSPIAWNYQDFTKADHRVQLYCELTLFKEEEDLLMLAKGDLQVRSQGECSVNRPSHAKGERMFSGVLLVSNKTIYVLSISGAETEEPGDWLHLVTSSPVSHVSRVVGLVGGQGVGLDMVTPHQSSVTSPSSSAQLYRLAGYTTAAAAQASDNNDVYTVVLGDKARTERMVDTLVEVMMERVRSHPVPVIWRAGQEQETTLCQQQGVESVQSMMMAYQVSQDNESWERVSIVLSDDNIIITEDFFSWIFTHQKERDLTTKASWKIGTLQKVSIYQSWLERTSLHFPHTKLKLRFDTEEGLQEFVKGVRGPWEAARGIKLEEATHFHLLGNKEVVMMNSLLADDSVVSQDLFDLPQWIKVTTVSNRRK